MKASQHIQRAQELRERGRLDLAESALSDAIDAAVAEEDLILLTRVRFLLGALLFEQDRDDEALPYLKAVVRTERVDGAVDSEVKEAARMLRQMRDIAPE
ncbi:hypothetical protein KRR26_13525 [Corallococcus sp. M34]|uniref:hypothetical protein n=1 Tax=Citreicoccus inhibens TaxID=2849499 RepID=UPI001C22DDE3|nr:hypothetical protein [Citreicoccus inhibens]MBU8896632.1 hypothetical protein [Citreicoccus inhibens]